jgi:hypothetical protein
MFTDSYGGMSVCRLCGAAVPAEMPLGSGENWDPQEIHEEWHRAKGEVYD